MLLLHYSLGFVFLREFILNYLIEIIEELILQNESELAKKVLNDNAWKINALSYNDLMATVLYGEDAYEEALKFLSINEILLKNEVLLTDMLFTTYFQIGNCYHALNKMQKAHGYYALCFESLDGTDPLLHEMQRMLNY